MRLDAFGAACFILLDVFKMNSPGHRCCIGWRKLGGRSSGYAHAAGLRTASVLALFTPNSHTLKVRLAASKVASGFKKNVCLDQKHQATFLFL